MFMMHDEVDVGCSHPGDSKRNVNRSVGKRVIVLLTRKSFLLHCRKELAITHHRSGGVMEPSRDPKNQHDSTVSPLLPETDPGVTAPRCGSRRRCWLEVRN